MKFAPESNSFEQLPHALWILLSDIARSTLVPNYLMVDALGSASGAQLRTGPTPAFITTFDGYGFPYDCKREMLDTG
jgi:hypothetical protein